MLTCIHRTTAAATASASVTVESEIAGAGSSSRIRLYEEAATAAGVSAETAVPSQIPAEEQLKTLPQRLNQQPKKQPKQKRPLYGGSGSHSSAGAPPIQKQQRDYSTAINEMQQKMRATTYGCVRI